MEVTLHCQIYPLSYDASLLFTMAVTTNFEAFENNILEDY